MSIVRGAVRSTCRAPVNGAGGGGAVTVNRYAQFNGTTDEAVIPATTHTAAAGTLMVRCKLDVATPPAVNQTGLCEWSAIGQGTHYPYTTGQMYATALITPRKGPFALSAIDRTAWHWLIIRDDASGGWEVLQSLDDGVLVSVITSAHTAWTNPPTSRFIGRNVAGNHFAGGMDRFLVGDSRWSDAQIQAVIAGGNGPGDALVRFEFNEISGGKFLDSSGNGKHATITGTPIITDF